MTNNDGEPLPSGRPRPRGVPFPLLIGGFWTLSLLAALVWSISDLDAASFLLSASGLLVSVVGLAVGTRRWWRRAGRLWTPVLYANAAALLGPFALGLLLVPGVRSAVLLPPTPMAFPWWRKFLFWDVARWRSLAFTLAVTDGLFVVVWFGSAVVVGALVVISPSVGYEHGYRQLVLYLGSAAAVATVLVTWAWVDRRRVCRAYEPDSSVGRNGSLVLGTTATLVGATIVLGAGISASYGAYTFLYGGPFPPARGVIAFGHSLHESTIYGVDKSGRHLRKLLQEAGPVYQAVESPDGKQIAYLSNRDGGGEIYIMKADGKERRQLTDTPAFNIDPAWSADGRRIAFSSARDGNPEIYVMKPDGSGQRRLTTSPGRDENPVWSPDGSWIAFSSDRDGDNEIYVARADGRGQRRLTKNGADDSFPAWSPDGSAVAFASERDGDGEIYLVRVRDRRLTRLTQNHDEDTFPAWSPDGRRLAFVSDRAGDEDIFVMDAGGREQRNLTRTSTADDFAPHWNPSGTITFATARDAIYEIGTVRPGGEEGTFPLTGAFEPAWSADGSELVWASYDGDIYVTDADWTTDRQLTRSNAYDWSPDWSPAGRQIVFVSDRSGEAQIYVMSARGSKPRQLTERGMNDDPTWSPDGRTITFDSDRTGSWRLFDMRIDGGGQRPLAFAGQAVEPAWSPDGRQLAFVSDRDGRWEIYVAAADGAHARKITRAPIGYDDSIPTWSPDGRRIAFDRVGDDGSDVIYVIPVRGGAPQAIVRGPEPAYGPDWQPRRPAS